MGRRRCNWRCYEAKSPECRCQCNGVNHGVGETRARENFQRLGLLWKTPSNQAQQSTGDALWLGLYRKLHCIKPLILHSSNSVCIGSGIRGGLLLNCQPNCRTALDRSFSFVPRCSDSSNQGRVTGEINLCVRSKKAVLEYAFSIPSSNPGRSRWGSIFAKRSTSALFG